ncbi:hypothetical protein DYH09_03070 [bacterium CPR1]|nr:hypothetical protein [bacterium CPR1]
MGTILWPAESWSEEVLPVLEAAEAAARAHGAEDCSAALRLFLAGGGAIAEQARQHEVPKVVRVELGEIDDGEDGSSTSGGHSG